MERAADRPTGCLRRQAYQSLPLLARAKTRARCAGRSCGGISNHHHRPGELPKPCPCHPSITGFPAKSLPPGCIGKSLLHRLIPQFRGLTDDSVVSPRFTRSGLYNLHDKIGCGSFGTTAVGGGCPAVRRRSKRAAFMSIWGTSSGLRPCLDRRHPRGRRPRFWGRARGGRAEIGTVAAICRPTTEIESC